MSQEDDLDSLLRSTFRRAPALTVERQQGIWRQIQEHLDPGPYYQPRPAEILSEAGLVTLALRPRATVTL